VLEQALIAEIHRILRPGGSLLVTVPFSARVHHAPQDFHRFTRYRLATMFAGFDIITIDERGDDFAVLANKLIVICLRLVRPSIAMVWSLPLLAVLAPMAIVGLLVAHLSLWLHLGSKADPLGYAIVATKA
jgi:SAM-dependent methyltransferase